MTTSAKHHSVISFFCSKGGQILFLGLVLAGVGALIGETTVTLGVLAAIPVSLFNYYYVAGAIPDKLGENETPRQIHNRFMGRALVRFIVSCTAILLAILGGAEFVLGVAIGLVLQMLSCIFDILQLGLSKGRKLWKKDSTN
jgi:hypothetical protein